ncbi:MAG: CidA/LrgA family protein [Spirochaetaceae bacterium]|nr:CidA/LrgA family protein [Spirochaetaceae bacterium]
MKIINQLAIILFICLLGDYIATLLPFVFPGSIISLILLFILLTTNILREKAISTVSDFLLINMALFFVPAGVGIIDHFNDISSIIGKFAIIITISTILTFFCASKSVTFVIYCCEKANQRKENKRKIK